MRRVKTGWDRSVSHLLDYEWQRQAHAGFGTMLACMLASKRYLHAPVDKRSSIGRNACADGIPGVRKETGQRMS